MHFLSQDLRDSLHRAPGGLQGRTRRQSLERDPQEWLCPASRPHVLTDVCPPDLGRLWVRILSQPFPFISDEATFQRGGDPTLSLQSWAVELIKPSPCPKLLIYYSTFEILGP